MRDRGVPFLSKGHFEGGQVVGGGGLGEVRKCPPQKSRRLVTGRKYVFCPIRGCAAPPLKKMPQHLRQYHHLSDEYVKRHLQKKRFATPGDVAKYKRGGITIIAADTNQPDVRSYFGGSSQEVGRGKGLGSVGKRLKGKERAREAVEERVEETMDEGSGASAAMKASTRGMQMHDLKQYEGFLTFLLSRQGGKKSEKNARGIVANVAKFHHYSSPESLNTEISLRAKAVRAFVAHLESSMGLGPSGLTQKILDIEAHIKYLMCESEGSPEEGDVNVKGEASDI